MIWVYRNGQLVPKHGAADRGVPHARSDFPAPTVSRFEPMESPVTGKTISSWRERDLDMQAVDAVDVRDYPKGHEFKRGRKAQLKEARNVSRRTASHS
jgi:hypothetical protein